MRPFVARPILSFLALACGISWSIIGIGAALGVDGTSPNAYMIMAALSMFGPAVAAIVQQRYFDKAPWSGLGLPLDGTRWKFVGLTMVVGVLIVPLVLLVADVLGNGLGISSFGHVEVSQARLVTSIEEQMAAAGVKGPALSGLLEGVELPGTLIFAMIQFVVVIVACSLNLPAMLGEELGWRGYLFQATAMWSGGRRVAFTGLVWGLWHAPIISMGHNYPDHPVLGIFLMEVFCMLLAVLFDWSRWRSKSVWAPCMLHGIINGSAGAYMLFAWGGHSLVGSPVGVAGFLAIATLAAATLLLDRSYRRVFRSGPILADDRSSYLAS